MARYIDADKLIEKICKEKGCFGTAEGNEPFMAWEVEGYINDMETEDVAPVVHAHWEDVPFALSYCSACLGYYVNIDEKYDFTYCPHCGAIMDEVI